MYCHKKDCKEKASVRNKNMTRKKRIKVQLWFNK